MARGMAGVDEFGEDKGWLRTQVGVEKDEDKGMVVEWRGCRQRQVRRKVCEHMCE